MKPVSNGIIWLDLIPNLIAGGACVAAILFVVIYASFSNWRKTGPGKSLMYAVLSLAAVLAMNTLHLAFAPYPGVEFVRMAVYTGLLLSIVRLIIALVAILRDTDDVDLNSFINHDHKEPK
jgi:ABC-type sugar transport system permease subunit